MNTEIYGTFGPSCSTQDILEKMIAAGMTGMRLNLSHTSLENSKNYIDAYQNAAKKYNVKPQILIDMQGPELRVGHMASSMVLEEGDMVVLEKISNDKINTEKSLDTSNQSFSQGIPVPEVVIQALNIGDEVLMDDGKILMVITENTITENAITENAVAENTITENAVAENTITETTTRKTAASKIADSETTIFEKMQNAVNARVIRGGILKGHKSIKIVDKDVAMPVLTAHDIQNIKMANMYGVTALMQPFVRNGRDLVQVRKMLKDYNAENIQIFAKIENRQGVDAMETIIPESDVIVIARGDLGNDMPLWKLPAVQKQIEACCKKHGKPFIVVTQMLASMETNPVPTRAEVSDIFNAVVDGAGGVMITGESAVGKYPAEAITYLAKTACEGEYWRDTHQ